MPLGIILDSDATGVGRREADIRVPQLSNLRSTIASLRLQIAPVLRPRCVVNKEVT